MKMAANSSTRRNSSAMILNHKYYTKVIKKLDELWRLSCNPDFNLPKSAPNIVQILSEILKKLNSIQANHPGPVMNEIFTNDYANAFVRSLEENVKSFKTQLTENKVEVAKSQTPSRKKVITSIVHFTYLQKQLNYFFPDGTFNKNCLIHIFEARNWWKANFNDSVFVPVTDFVEIFCSSFNINGTLKKRKLTDEINFCKTNYITVFEFELFCKLFSPWNKLIDMWEALTVHHPGYLSYATYDDVTAHLEKFKGRPGTYVFRMSCTSLGCWSIGFVREDGNIAQTVVKMKTIVEALVDGKEKSVYKFPGGSMDNPDLHYLLPTTDTVMVTDDKANEYGALDMSFELCKICVERDKDVRIDPCGHLICSDCLKNWTSKNRGDANCPFCRTIISSSTKIVLNKSPSNVMEMPPQLSSSMRERQSTRESIGSSSGFSTLNSRKDSVSSLESYVNSGMIAANPRPPSERLCNEIAIRPLPRPPSEDASLINSRKNSMCRSVNTPLPPVPQDEYDLPKIDGTNPPIRSLPPIPVEEAPTSATAPSPVTAVSPAPDLALCVSDVQPTADYAYFNGVVDPRAEDDYSAPVEIMSTDEQSLIAEGYSQSSVKNALQLSNGDVQKALQILRTFVNPVSP